MSRYAKINKNDVANGKGVCVSFWAQGCQFRCPGCHNKDTWDFNGGKEFTEDTLMEIIEAIDANGIKRNLSILGGEPLAPANLAMTYSVVTKVRKEFPNITIYMWTGYCYEDLLNPAHQAILRDVDILIDGQFIETAKDNSITYAGSNNQRIIDVQSSLSSQELRILDNL